MDKKNALEIELSHLDGSLVLYIDSNNEDIEEDINNQYDHEAKYKIREGCFYDYNFSNEKYRLRCSDQENIVQQRKRQKHCGRIVPNIYVGTLSLDVLLDETKIDSIQIEVQSKKTSYREDYRYMLNSIAEKCTDLILQSNSPVSHSFESDFNEDNKTLYQRFAFVNSMINSDEFDEAIQRIITSPTTIWKEEEALSDVRSIKRFKNGEIRKLINAQSRQELPSNHRLRRYGLTSIATKIDTYQKKESVDTPENRFIKHALETFLKFSFDIFNHPNAGLRLITEASIVSEKLENHLQHDIFKEISRPITLKLNSPTLQRKEGYREILNVWIKFDLAAKLIWSGGEDVYQGEKKDIATLYEYWLFFKFLDVLNRIFEIKPSELESLIVPSKDKLNLQLKQGKFTALNGVYNKGNRPLNIRFNYNRSFASNDNHKQSGSWTTTLRPDYTLSIWPTDLSEIDAEKNEQIVHIHFDAKYKIANINQILGNKEGSDLDKEKKDNLKGIYKNVDLLKMHAYKDAIRRTSGAYVLYPGDVKKRLEGFHEILPGLGAFPIKPSENINETLHLENFIKEILQHFLNRSTQRENLAIKSYRIHKNDSPNKVMESLPEYINTERIIPDETFVLVGFYKDDKHHKWIQKGQYNFRMGSGNGSLVLDKETVIAKYLLLHTFGETKSSDLWEITSDGPRVYSKANLIKKGYPSKNSKDHYLVIDIKKVKMTLFGNKSWDFRKLSNYTSGHQSAKPFTTTLTELSKNVIES